MKNLKEGFEGSSSAPRSRGKSRKGKGLAALVLILCVMAVALFAVLRWAGSEEIYGGVSAGGVDLGGMTREEARKSFVDQASQPSSEVKLTGPGEQSSTIRIPDAHFDAAATVDRAYEAGRGGGITERLHATFGEVKVTPKVDYDPEKARAEVEKVAAQVDEQPRDALASATESGVKVIEARKGYEVEVAATMDNVDRAVGSMSGEARVSGKALDPEISTGEAEQAAKNAREAASKPVTLVDGDEKWTLLKSEISPAIEISPENGNLRVGLDRGALDDTISNKLAGLTDEPVDADYQVSGTGVSVIPGREGTSIDEEELLDEISTGIFQGDREYDVKVSTEEPDFTTAKAEELKPTTLLGDYRTDYMIVPGDKRTRNENLRIASGAITGTLVAPGEVFSMNDTVSGLDYEAAKVIIDGKETKTDGGGLCQVTSTLYMAANFAGLDVIERHPHYSQLPYIRPGMDATVWFGTPPSGAGELDMKFRNTTDGYLLLREYVANDGYIYAEIYGRPNDTRVHMYSNPVYVNDDQSSWVTYQKVVEDGKVVFDGELHKDVYGPLESKGEPIPPPIVNISPVDP